MCFSKLQNDILSAKCTSTFSICPHVSKCFAVPSVPLDNSYRIFGGLIADIKRKVRWYPSDFRDALSVQAVASFVFLYFACLTPIITFGGLLGDATDMYMVR